jgi:hypothetical protein
MDIIIAIVQPKAGEEEEAVTVDTSLYGNFAHRFVPRPALPTLAALRPNKKNETSAQFS